MKKSLTTLLIAMLATAAAIAGGAEITFEKSLFDFGEIEKGQKVEHTFVFQNTGDEDLEIQEVRPSCGCTTAEPDKTVYKPNEKGEIPVTFDSSRFEGPINKTVTVVSNAKENPRMQLKIKGNITQEINVNPNYLTLVNIKRSQEVERDIQVTTERLEKLEISDVTSNLDFLKLSVEEKGAKEVVVKVRFSGKDVPTDRPTHSGFISFKTNGKSQPDVKVNTYIKVANPIQPNPRAVYMFASEKGKAREVEVNLKSTADEAFKITDVKSDLEFVSVEKVDDAKLKVTLSQEAKEGKFTGTIEVKTDLEEQPSLRIPVRGNVI
jgi:hypothetical protein